jgi:predicted RNA binding protein YcfA (HicA-like mRNA interferase family)
MAEAGCRGATHIFFAQPGERSQPREVREAEALGFELDRTRGSHHIYRHPTVRQRINLQPHRGQAKPYQLRQLLDVVERHALRLEEDTP